MSLFDKFKKKKNDSESQKSSGESADPKNNPDMIRLYDKYGREIYITKDQWRKDILPGGLRDNWDHPDELYSIIVQAIYDGFHKDVVKAAEHLFQIDPIKARGACIWGIVLMEEGKLDDAEKIFKNHISEHGEDGVILTNLAKVYSRRRDYQKAEEILWHALEIDPNQSNGLGWYEEIHRERSGDEAAMAALRKIADLPNSWRAQLWLAHAALKTKNLEEAIAYYDETLSRVEKPVPSDVLMQISGDLGNAGYLDELLQLVEPHFEVEFHGLQVGNNLIRAHMELGNFEASRAILEQLYALKRPDWAEHLNYWETELSKVRIESQEIPEDRPLEMEMLTIAGPIWLKSSSPESELFPSREKNSPVISFLGSTAEVPTPSEKIQMQRTDVPGRLSRALPLFFAEQIEFHTKTRVQTMIPSIAGEARGFVLSGNQWKDEEAVDYSRLIESKSDYVVTLHLKTVSEPWQLEIRLIGAQDGALIGEVKGHFASTKNPDGAIMKLVSQLIELLNRSAKVELQNASPLYQVPTGNHFSDYLVRLEQLLAVVSAGIEGTRSDFLSGEREIINGNLQLCLDCPQNVNLRILLTQTLAGIKKVRPDILEEFSEKILMLQKENPLSEPVQGMLELQLNHIFES